MIKINKNVVKWVLDLYLNCFHSNTWISMKDFSERYKVSYPTMRKFLPLFFDFDCFGKINSDWNCKYLVKKSEIELYFEHSKSFIPPRDYENIMSLFFSFPTAVESMKNKIKLLQSEKENEN